MAELDPAVRARLEQQAQPWQPHDHDWRTVRVDDLRALLAATQERDAIQAHYSSLRRKYDDLETRHYAALKVVEPCLACGAELYDRIVWDVAEGIPRCPDCGANVRAAGGG